MKHFILAAFLCLSLFFSSALVAAPQQPQTGGSQIEIIEVNIDNESNPAANPDNKSQTFTEGELVTGQKLTPEQRNQKIKDADGTGIGITLMSMCIVICSLIVLSLLFLAFGKISHSMHTKKKLKNYGLETDMDNHEAYSGEACAAIAAALHQYFNDRHDIEDHVLTMRKLKRAYSPWSSKLYGLRHLPERNTWHR